MNLITGVDGGKMAPTDEFSQSCEFFYWSRTEDPEFDWKSVPVLHDVIEEKFEKIVNEKKKQLKVEIETISSNSNILPKFQSMSIPMKLGDDHIQKWDGKKASKKAEPSASVAGPAVVPTKKVSTSEDAEAAAVARQNQLNEQQAQGFLYFFLLRTVCILVAVRSSGILKGKQKLGVTFNSNFLGGIDFTKFSKLTICSA